jgi:hypothetical protein
MTHGISKQLLQHHELEMLAMKDEVKCWQAPWKNTLGLEIIQGKTGASESLL